MKQKQTRKTKKASATIGHAKKILEFQKKDYQRIFELERKSGENPKYAAMRAGAIYRKRYGRTRTDRWRKALKIAK